MKTIAALASLALAAPSLAQLSSVSPWQKFSWSENVGWMNWRDAGSPLASQGAFIHATFVTGFVWCENVGWINLGDVPANQLSHDNSTGADFGVNVLPGGGLSGLAWGENIGWINFDAGAGVNPASAARYDAEERRLRGYAWGENIGWINLDDSDDGYVGFLCPADFDQNAFVNGDDYDFFMDAFIPGTPAADFDHNTFVNGEDYDAFMAAFIAGC